MMTHEKVCFVLAVLAAVAPVSGAASDAPITDGGVFQGPSSAYSSAVVRTSTKSGAAGGTLRSTIQPGGDAQALAAGTGGAVKERVPGGSLPDVAPAAGEARAFRAGGAGGGPKSGTAGGTMPSGEVTAGHAQALRAGSEGAVKSGVPGGTLPAASPSSSAGDPGIRSPREDVPAARK